MTNIDSLFEQIEQARERSDYPGALSLAEQAVIDAVEADLPEKLVNALAHKLVIYKHLFQKTENLLFNELMLGDITSGLAIIQAKGLKGQPKAVMLLRQGDYYVHLEKFAEALPYYKAALENISKENLGEYAEYLSHYGIARVYAGEDEGLLQVEGALKAAEQDDILRPFHKLVITSGILLRLAAAFARRKERAKFNEYFDLGWVQAQKLKNEFEMPMRASQAERLKKKVGVE